MAYSYNEFTGTTNTTYNLSFTGPAPGYIDRTHVKFYKNGILQDDSLRTFITDTQVQIAAPLVTDIVKFQRETSPTTPLVDWIGGESVSEYNLDKNTLQMLYVAQEASDRGAIDTSVAQGYATAAAASAAAAATAKTNAETAETNAELAETNAEAAAAYVASQTPNWHLQNDLTPVLGANLSLNNFNVGALTAAQITALAADQSKLVDLAAGNSSTVNELINGNFKFWSIGTSAVPDGYVLDGAGTVARETLGDGDYAARLTNTASNAYGIKQDVHSRLSLNNWKVNGYASARARVYCDTASRVTLNIMDGVNTSTVTHGGTGWEWLSISAHNINASATKISAEIDISTGTSIYCLVDQVTLVPGKLPAFFSPLSPEETPWVDIFATASVIGITSPTGYFLIKRVGSMIIAVFKVAGTGSTTSFSFTMTNIPVSAFPETLLTSLGRALDAGSYSETGKLSIATGSNVVAFHKTSAGGATSWTASGSREVYGMFTMPIA